MSNQPEIRKSRVNIKLVLHTGTAKMKVEPRLVGCDFGNGAEQHPLSERQKVNINLNNMNSVLAEFSPSVSMAVENTRTAITPASSALTQPGRQSCMTRLKRSPAALTPVCRISSCCCALPEADPA